MVLRLFPLILIPLLLVGCRGFISEKPAIHPNINMDYNPKFKSQSNPQDIPDGTVPYSIFSTNVNHSSRADVLQSDSRYYKGTDSFGNFVPKAPISVNKDTILKGQSLYNIYCSMCHDRTGSGNGIVIKRGFLPPPNLSESRLKNSGDGYLYHVITNGVRNMQGYGKQLPVSDRWAIVLYVRALQKANQATLSDVPREKRNQIK